MNVRRIVTFNIVGLIVLLAVVYGGWHWYYQRSHFVTTQNAFVEGDEYPLNVQFAGDLTTWTVTNGDNVSAGQVLGQVDTSTELQQLGAIAQDKKVSKSVADAASITSPIAGTVLNANVSSGQMVSPQQPVGYVVNLNQLYIVANIRETQLQHVEVGDTVDVSLDAFPSQSFKGTVQSIGLTTSSALSLIPSSDATSGSYTKVVQTIPIRIKLSGYGGERFLPGMSATVHIHRQNN